MWERFMDELRERHLGRPRADGSASVFDQLRAACEAEVARSTRA